MKVRAAVLVCLLIAPAGVLRAAETDTSFSAVASWPGDDAIAEAAPGDVPPDAAAAAEPKQETPESVLTPPADSEAQLSLREAVLLALRNNLDIELARTEPMIAQEGVEAAKGAYDPVLEGSFGFDRGRRFSVNRLSQNAASQNGRSLNTQDNWTYGAGFKGILPFGLQYSSTTGVNRLDSSIVQVPLDKQYDSNWTSQLTLPLLRDLGWNAASVTVRRSEISRDMSEDQFRAALNGIVAGVEDLYWNLSANRANVRVAAKSLKTAQDLLEQTKVQQEVGVVSRVAVTQAEAGVAERELLFIQAENLAASAKDALLDALLAPSAQVFEDRDLIPESPRFENYKVDVDSSIQKALRSRPELAQAKKAVDMADVEADFAKNQARPRFDLTAGYGVSGLSGSPKGATTINGTPVPPVPDQGSSVDSFDDFFRSDGAKSYSAGMRVEMPLGNNTGEARAVQARIQARRATIALKKQEQQVIREVREAARGVRAATQSVSAAERRVAATQETLRAEQERLRLGDSTPFQVLQFDEDLAEAEQSMIVALRQQANAITALERVQGTLLDTRGIKFEDELAR